MEYEVAGSFGALDSPYCDQGNARVVVLPVAYDGTAEWHSGTRDGPRAIIEASHSLEIYDIELERNIGEVGIYTLPEILPETAGAEHMVQRVYEVTRPLLSVDKMVLMLGGEHTLTLGAVRAYRERYPELSVLQMDAHADLRDCYLGTDFSQATVMRRVNELCPLVPVGIRSLSEEEHQFITETGITPFYAHDFISGNATNQDIIKSLSRDVYITIDLDVLDPSVMPAVGTPEPGGIGWYQLLGLLREVARNRHIVGFDLVELCPPEGPDACAFTAAKLAYKLIGYIFEGKVE
jgi:agmatinase